MLDRVLPHSLEGESSVLGALLIDKDAIIKVIEFLRAEDFYSESNRIVYETILELYQKSVPIDLITISEALKRKNKFTQIGGSDYLTSLMNSVPTAANVASYAGIVEKKAILRNLIKAGTEIVSKGYDENENVDLALDRSEQIIFNVGNRRVTQGFVPIKPIALELFERIENRHSNKSGITGVPSGFKRLDEITAGFQPSDLIIIAARPGVGKTAFCLNVAQYVAVEESLPVAIFSLEMSKDQLVQRMLCSMAKVDSHRFRTGYLPESDIGLWERISKSLAKLAVAPIFIDDSAVATPMEIRAKSRRLTAERGIKLIIIDYLQMIKGSSSRIENRNQEIAEISRSMKALAKELDVPVIVLSQLSREVEKRQEKRPQLSDLRESGAIEQDADLVAFIYRDAYYDRKATDDELAKKKNTISEVIVSKQRNGPLGIAKLSFIEEYTLFADLDEYHDDMV